jgi:hypothetical protein
LKFAAKKKAGVGSFVPEEKPGQTIKENPSCVAVLSLAYASPEQVL